EIYSSLPKESYWTKQMIWVGVGLAALFFSAVFDYRRIYNYVPHIYGAGIVMLILVLMFGEVVKGQRNWIKLGFFNLQPSEFVKLAVILALARYLSPLRKSDLPLKDLAVACAIAGVPVCLILLQPDAGSSTTFFPVLAVILFISGMNMRLLIVTVVAGLVLWPLTYVFALKPKLLKPYQVMRIEAVVNPQLFEQPEFRRQFGYQTMQSIIAVGSGGVAGTGVTKGTQSRLGFLPEHHTDFIGSVMAEETGFI